MSLARACRLRICRRGPGTAVAAPRSCWACLDPEGAVRREQVVGLVDVSCFGVDERPWLVPASRAGTGFGGPAAVNRSIAPAVDGDETGEKAVGETGQGPVSVLVLGWSRGRRWTDPALTIRSRRGTAYEHQNRRWSRNDPPAAIWRAEGSRQQDRAEPRTSPAPHVVSRETLRRPGKLHLEPQRYRLPGPDPPDASVRSTCQQRRPRLCHTQRRRS